MPVYKDKERGSWYCMYRINGKQIKKSGFATKGEASAFERVALQEKSIKSIISFTEIRDSYLDHYKTTNKPVSYYTIRKRIEKHIDPYFAKSKTPITNKAVLEWQNDLIKQGYSVSYIRNLRANLSSIFLHGMRYYGLASNPCQIVAGVKNKHKEEMKFWTIQEFKMFMTVVEDPLHYALFSTLFWTGMRKGELLALRWRDITDKTIKVRNTISAKDGTGGWHLTPPKTASSKRDILMTKELKTIIDDLYQERKKLVEFDIDYFVFGADNPMSSTTLWRIYERYLSLSTVKRIRIHDFRHSFASCLIEAGVDIMLLAKMLGHSSREQVFKTYGHLYPDKQEEAIKKLENVTKLLL